MPSGLALALGLTAFCFGGHGAFPKLYLSMQEPDRVYEVLWYVGPTILSMYGSVMTLGYFFYAQKTLIPGLSSYLHFLYFLYLC
jgi:amino acid permease